MSKHEPISAAIAGSDGAVMLRVKVVPGASRSRVMGMLGDRLKLSVAAAPEGGKANRAVCVLVAGKLKVPVRDIVVSAGITNPKKTLSLAGLTIEQVVERLTGTLPD